MARAFSANRYPRNPQASNTTPSGIPQGTMGGSAMAGGSRPGRPQVMLGDEMYLWILLGIEVATMAIFRKQFRRHHGG